MAIQNAARFVATARCTNMTTVRLAALSLVLGTMLTGMAGAAEPTHPATLTVTGTGTITRAPDRATISFSIQTTDANSVAATSANAAIASAIGAKMAALGLSASATVTSSYGLSYNPRPTKPDPSNDQRYGYTVSRTIDVTTDAIERAGPIVDAGVAAGATNVNGVSFMLRDPQAAQRAAQAAALADAVAQARALATEAGVRLVRIRSLAPGGAGGVGRPMPMMRMALAAAPVPTTIDPGSLSVSAEVTVQYEIAPAP
jgi:uncharacterized protein YggE